jgi:DNA-binding beta-propeller fold protein YncE
MEATEGIMKYRSLAVLMFLVLPVVMCTAENAPLKEIGTTPLPHITGGDFDHFAADLKNRRLYVAAEVYASIEVFDLDSGKHLLSSHGVVKSPRKIAFLEDKNQLMVADAGTASCEFLDAKDLHLIASVPLEPGPDAGVYDPEARIFYVGNGGRAAHEPFSYVSRISVDTHQVIGRTRVEAATIKTLVLDSDAQKLYITMRDKNQVGVINLSNNVVEQTWSNPELKTDSAMAYDEQGRRLFVGDRNPGRLIVLNTGDGSVVASLPIGDTSDDMTYDRKRHRLYISSADGVDVVSQDSPDKYRVIQHIDTSGGKTSLYVPSLHRYFVIHTKGEKANEAGLQIFDVQ